MASDELDTVMGGAAGRASQDQLLRQAVATLRIRYEEGDGHPGLSPEASQELARKLTGITEAGDPVDDGREQAIALAHRLLDNDHPEQSPLWPKAGER